LGRFSWVDFNTTDTFLLTEENQAIQELLDLRKTRLFGNFLFDAFFRRLGLSWSA
jgi:hypothetical protein